MVSNYRVLLMLDIKGCVWSKLRGSVFQFQDPTCVRQCVALWQVSDIAAIAVLHGCLWCQHHGHGGDWSSAIQRLYYDVHDAVCGVLDCERLCEIEKCTNRTRSGVLPA